MKNIFQLVKNLKKINKKIIHSIHQNISLTGEEFYFSILNVNNLFKKIKFNKNDKVAILYENSIEYIILSFFIFLKNCTLVPINPNLKNNEINSILKLSNAKYIISSNKNKFICKNIFFKFKTELIRKNIKFTFVKKKVNYLLLLYTSGSTGIPKGALISEQNLFHHSHTLSRHHKLSNKTNTLVLMPMFHNNGFVISFMSSIIKFSNIYICPAELVLPKFFEIVNFYKINFTSLMPAVLSMILHKSQTKKIKHKILISCGGQKLSKNLTKTFEKKTNAYILEHYGLTETTSVCAINNFRNRDLDAVGYTLKHNIMKIFANNKLRYFGFGEICVKGPNVIKEYYNNKTLNKDKWILGFFKTGDYGFLNKKKKLFFKSRKDFLIIKSGENVYPAEIENVAYQYKNTIECAVVGGPDKLTGENIFMFIKLKKNSFCIRNEFENLLKKNLAKFKIPKKIFYLNFNIKLNELPKTISKKIKYGELKKLLK